MQGLTSVDGSPRVLGRMPQRGAAPYLRKLGGSGSVEAWEVWRFGRSQRRLPGGGDCARDSCARHCVSQTDNCSRGPQDRMNIRMVQTMAFKIPLVLGLTTSVQAPQFHDVSWGSNVGAR